MLLLLPLFSNGVFGPSTRLCVVCDAIIRATMTRNARHARMHEYMSPNNTRKKQKAHVGQVIPIFSLPIRWRFSLGRLVWLRFRYQISRIALCANAGCALLRAWASVKVEHSFVGNVRQREKRIAHGINNGHMGKSDLMHGSHSGTPNGFRPFRKENDRRYACTL